MSENPIIISNLNDFIFCPVSIYFHSLEPDAEDFLAKDIYQINGTDAHKNSDHATYSTKKSMLQGTSIFSAKYDLCGKIDTFDCDTGILTERKKKITNLYDGYIFQLYAQYFSLSEMGYTVKKIRFYSIDDNKIYNVKLPKDDAAMFEKFEKLLNNIKNFDFSNFVQKNKLKCAKCIYEPLCSFSAFDGTEV